MKKRDKIIYWIATIWLSLGMLSSGILQAFNIKMEGDATAELGYPTYFFTLLGCWKILGIVVLLTPKIPLVKEWAYAGFFFAMSGAAFSHLAVGSVDEIFPSLLLLMLTVVSWYFRPAGRKMVVAN